MASTHPHRPIVRRYHLPHTAGGRASSSDLRAALAEARTLHGALHLQLGELETCVASSRLHQSTWAARLHEGLGAFFGGYIYSARYRHTNLPHMATAFLMRSALALCGRYCTYKMAMASVSLVRSRSAASRDPLLFRLLGAAPAVVDGFDLSFWYVLVRSGKSSTSRSG